ncbi:hypothetical protein E4U42_004176 [Claviceps africana]|uniref:BZIP domain-containing protein n=1 Tax=Claviceps africana TaxID=83212 RepID=A0A8K0J8D6_9HYPO|nr:hypothetical protein E4U42_004176 [Claviceps africana]
MASSDGAGDSLPPNFLLTPHQQSLLFAALNANNQHHSTSSPTAKDLSLSAKSSHSSPMQLKESGASIQESPYLDNYDYDFGDTSFDFSFASAGADEAKMTGDAPGTANSDSADGEAPEKRSHPDDGEDDSSPGNDTKRRESGDKVTKKPGRKPLTSEPTSKRKAQNRAAQRAFRERKEKHLKDLETKVEELEKASEAANHENSKLRAQVEHMTTELTQYKQRLAVMMHKPASREKTLFGDAALNNLSDVSFQFEFPKFGALPGSPIDITQSTSQPVSPQQNGGNGQDKSSVSSFESEKELSRPRLQQQQQRQHQSHTGPLFNLAPASARPMSASTGIGSCSSLDSVPFSIAAATSSPSASSNSNAGGPSSSCGTSPESFTQSPAAFKPLETLTTIGEEQAAPATTLQQSSFPPLGKVDIGSTSFDWLVQQNGGGSFDPELFGDYREAQENVLSNPSFDDFVFHDSTDADFFTPFNTAPTNYPTKTMTKKNLIAEIDAQQDAIENDEAKTPGMSCHQLWEKIHECPKAQNDDFDLDGLCSELTKKAKCSGSGPVIAPSDFDSILKKYMGKVARADGMPDQAGLAVKKPTELSKAGLGISSSGVV